MGSVAPATACSQKEDFATVVRAVTGVTEKEAVVRLDRGAQHLVMH
jgi:hypothetical protein